MIWQNLIKHHRVIGLASALGTLAFSAAVFARMSQPSQAQQQAFAACMQQQGVSLPSRPEGHGQGDGQQGHGRPTGTPPNFTTEQKAAFENCKSQGAQGPEAMGQCLQASGVTLPAPPQGGRRGEPSSQGRPSLSSNQMQAIELCRQQASNVH